MDHPEGAGLQRVDRVDFDPRVRLDFRGAQSIYSVRRLVMREMDDALGLSDLASAALCDNRRGKTTVHRLDGLFRQSVFGRLAGYGDVHDADWLAQDPVMRQIVGARAVDVQAASACRDHQRRRRLLSDAEGQSGIAAVGCPVLFRQGFAQRPKGPSGGSGAWPQGDPNRHGRFRQGTGGALGIPWPPAFGRIETRRKTDVKVQTETRHCALSSVPAPEVFMATVRALGDRLRPARAT